MLLFKHAFISLIIIIIIIITVSALQYVSVRFSVFLSYEQKLSIYRTEAH